MLRYLQLLLSQLNFTQSFVEDLLDLRQLKDGVFSLVQEQFNPNAVLDLVISIFKAQVDARRIDISHTVESDLKLPRGHQLPDTSQLLRAGAGSSSSRENAQDRSLPLLIGDKRRFK